MPRALEPPDIFCDLILVQILYSPGGVRSQVPVETVKSNFFWPFSKPYTFWLVRSISILLSAFGWSSSIPRMLAWRYGCLGMGTERLLKVAVVAVFW